MKKLEWVFRLISESAIRLPSRFPWHGKRGYFHGFLSFVPNRSESRTQSKHENGVTHAHMHPKTQCSENQKQRSKNKNKALGCMLFLFFENSKKRISETTRPAASSTIPYPPLRSHLLTSPKMTQDIPEVILT